MFFCVFSNSPPFGPLSVWALALGGPAEPGPSDIRPSPGSLQGQGRGGRSQQKHKKHKKRKKHKQKTQKTQKTQTQKTQTQKTQTQKTQNTNINIYIIKGTKQVNEVIAVMADEAFDPSEVPDMSNLSMDGSNDAAKAEPGIYVIYVCMHVCMYI